ncbi:hypothetical protein RQM47_01080 [Rubrivirga sp. S365]|uniref:Uncharacterized protein n=1 Tax=Rubrivirga litoralis TaxID=3075598 RepID=A0ABU3BSX6_9BACT|nr:MULTISPECIES: hypothetical protein [unclassified Rubrivirga]MDT0632401.1 hypothetical protein [Rubrivirga sp. F394]MDT7855228.1 hypothetical protein [Rubrivirga sp. S365]
MTRPALALLLFLASAALAQSVGRGGPSPVETYHEGAQAFIEGDVAAASAAVRAGLQAAPGDEKLQKLRDLIEQEQEEQDQRRGGQQDQDAENEDSEGQRDDEGQSGGEGQQQPPEDDEGGAERDQTDTQTPPPGGGGEEPDDQEGQQSPGRSVGEGGPTPAGDGAVPEGQMSRAQAERILDAVGGDERLLLRELRRSEARARRTDKDW